MSASFPVQDPLHRSGILSTEAADWTGASYFHGTGHCDCVDIRGRTEYLQQPSFELPSGTEEAAPLIPTEDWCETHMPCATRGILRKGYRHQYIVNGGGHYFSRNVRDAMDYAIMRLKESFVGELPRDQRLSLFLCKAQNVYHRVNSP
ncbi:hypothetical protein BGX33_004790 [Mortierella sp. NVP41]|nr:hypothetical protein BGX33_004790 [Mortierella sp. NVP41]